MILGYDRLYAPDAVEIALPDAASARTLVAARRPDLFERLQAVTQRIGAPARVLDATLLGAARLGLRHGSFGDDFHAYHNEGHVLELGDRRLRRALDDLGDSAPRGDDAAALLLFAACHDLRQRETVDVPGPVGGNEAASVAETFRILSACGFDPQQDRAYFVALEMMIAGSTFDARPVPKPDPRTDELPGLAGGALARGLALWLDSDHPGWREDADARRGERLGRLAADLDTANVGEDFVQLCDTALRLCREREMRAGRRLDAATSAAPSLSFLGPGQQHYFFELHRFCSREGESVFGAGKAANGPLVKKTSAAMLARFAAAPPANGEAVLAAFSELTGAC
ncbi:hypothetical protein [Arenimonas oryziterrae]|uniref:Uncharacterized protein n=1 Tax=Arenimonas oryziterrae DSM 21050 = YC6267 TaxID=1121015 RepID=A0A091AUN9_9GAMM|nr:hypothetical protein [Arenimonas oryziterrae]KFN43978.1 hypothetical protein N789_08490 [Arenimonas oryziterrae DSM 21050 = YC6267]